METLESNFEYPQYRQILGIVNRTRFYSQYREIPSATVGNHMGMHQIPLDTFGNPEYSNYLLFKRFLWRTRSSNKRWRPQNICSRASIVFIQTNPAKIQIYRHLLLATQIPRYLTVFGSPTSNSKCCQIPPNTIWELAFRVSQNLGCLTIKMPPPYWNLLWHPFEPVQSSPKTTIKSFIYPFPLVLHKISTDFSLYVVNYVHL